MVFFADFFVHNRGRGPRPVDPGTAHQSDVVASLACAARRSCAVPAVVSVCEPVEATRVGLGERGSFVARSWLGLVFPQKVPGVQRAGLKIHES